MDYLIETQRLLLRKFIPEDSAHFYAMNNDPVVMRYTGDAPFTSQDAAQKFIDTYTAYATTGIGRYAVIRKEDKAFLGWCGLKYHPEDKTVDVGYRFYKKYWGNGYATESTEACIQYAFAALKYVKLVAHTHVENEPSIKVLENCGMQRVKKIMYDSQPAYLYEKQNPLYVLKQITSEQTWPVRHPVLRAGRPLEDVYMEADDMPTTFHLGMFYKNKVIGVASFMEDGHPEFLGNQFRLRGMAVLPAFRKRGIAALLLEEGERLLIEKGRDLLWFNARTIALSFYKEQGYQIYGSEFDIPLVGLHYVMKKEL